MLSIKKKRNLIGVVGVSLLVTILTPIYIYKSNSIRHIPEGELINSVSSANKEYTVNTYLTSGTLSDFAVRGELINRLGIKKNIYWEYHEKNGDIKWINEKSVSINGKELKVPEETYDFRKHPA